MQNVNTLRINYFSRNIGLLIELVKKDLKLRYKGTVLGYLWLVLQPLFLAFIFVFIRNHVTHNFTAHKLDFVAMFAVLMSWQFFTVSFQRCANSLKTERARVAKKNNHSLIFIPISIVLSTLVGALVNVVVFFCLMLIVKKVFYIWAILLIPVLAISSIFITAMCILFSGLSCFIGDMVHIVPLINRFSLVGLPILYSVDVVPENFRAYYTHIPLVWMISKTKDVTSGINTISYSYSMSILLISTGSLLLVYLLFKKIKYLIANKVVANKD